MCRILGFRSVLDSRVHSSLMSADNALAVQSQAHPDGWGVAYYVAGSPHLVKATGAARTDTLFKRVSGVVTSQTVLAHIRKATQGDLSSLNSHPFQFGRWVMAHNGDVPEFGQYRDQLLQRVSPRLRRYVLGDTDSEIIFHLFLSFLQTEVELHRIGTPLEAVVRAVRHTVRSVRELADEDGRKCLLTIVVTDGNLMVAYQGGKELHFSTHKTSCSESGECPFYAPECEGPPASGHVNHLIVSSEPLSGENVWREMEEGEVVAVDHFMRFHRYPQGMLATV